MQCPSCKLEVDDEDRFCRRCGTKLGFQATTESSSAAAERRQLTVMFCDLVGSTLLSSRLDPEDFREVVQGYQEACAEVIQRFDGHVAQYLGDGSAPTATPAPGCRRPSCYPS